MRLQSTGRSPRWPIQVSSIRSGFTLVELIVVLVIIAATAGLVIPAVAMMGRSSDMAVSGHSQAALANNIQEFFVLQKRYPQGFDSLLVDGAHGAGTAAQDGTPDAVYSKVSNGAGDQVGGLTDSSPNLGSVLAISTLSSNQVRSLTRGGLDYVFDHEGLTVDGTTGSLTGEANANVSGKFKRSLTSSAAQSWATLRIPTSDTSSTDQAALTILQRLVPSEVTGSSVGTRAYTPETGTRLVAFGIGQNCRLVPTTMLSTPVYPGNDGKYYGRYIAIFKTFESGERAVLIGVVDPYGRTPDYTQQQFNESLPNGGRQG